MFQFLPLLTATLMVAAEAYFLPPHSQAVAQPGGYRGHPQGNQYWGDLNKIEESYNNRFLYQSPNYQQFSDSQRFASQGSLQAQQQYGPPQPQLLYQAGISPSDMLPESVYSDVRGAPILIQPYDEETTRQQTISVVPQYSGIQTGQSANAIPYDLSQQSTIEGGQAVSSVQGLQTTAQTTIPVLVRVSDKQSLIVPVRAVYALPGFLERLVQRVQGYYSIYNPVESLAVDRPYYVPTNNVQVNSGVIGGNVQPINQEIVQVPSLNGIVAGVTETSPVLDVKVDDLKQVEIKNDTSAPDNSVQNSTDTTTVENNSDDATTILPSSSTTDKPSPSPTTESSSPATTASPSEEPTTVNSEDKLPEETVETTTQPEIAETPKPDEPPAVETSPETPANPENENNSGSSDLQSAGYTYYRPRIPFYYPSRA